MELARPESVADAVEALGNGAVALAGGTELVPLLNSRIVRADTLVELRQAVPKGIDGTTIGAGTTLGELEVDPQIPEALREACRLSASPQLRATGTIGGNLLQATRCWYSSGETSVFLAFEIWWWIPRGVNRLGSFPSSSRHAFTSRTWSAWS